jgi:hypothetical protein
MGTDNIAIYKVKKAMMGGGLVALVIVFFGLTLPLIVEGTAVPTGQLYGLVGFWIIGIVLTIAPLCFKMEIDNESVRSFFLGLLIRDLHSSNIQSIEYTNLTGWGVLSFGKGLKGWEKTRGGSKYFSIGENAYGLSIRSFDHGGPCIARRSIAGAPRGVGPAVCPNSPAPARAFRNWLDGEADSNPSQSAAEPVSVRAGNSRRETVWRGQRLGRHFSRYRPISGDRDRAIPGLRRQSRGKSKTIPTAPGNRICAGLGGGAGRTQTDNHAIMSPKVTIIGHCRAFAPRFGRRDCGPIDRAPPAQAPSRWHRAGRSRQ